MSSRSNKHIIVIAFTAFVLALLTSPSVMAVRFAYPETKNLLENGSFERAGKPLPDGIPHGWIQSYGTASQVQSLWFGEFSPFGNKVLQLLDESITETVEVTSDYIEIVPGATYTVEGWIREYAPSTNKAYLYIKTYDTSKTNIDYVKAGNPSTTGWHKYSVSHRMPGHARYLKVGCRSFSDSWGAPSGSDDQMRFDGIALYQSETGDVLYQDAFDLALSDQGCCSSTVPSGWVKTSGTSDPDDVEMLSGTPVAIAFDDNDDTGKIVIRSPYIYVAPGVDYTASIQSWIDSGATGGQKGYLILRFYDHHEDPISNGGGYFEYSDNSATLGAYEQMTVGGPAPVGAAFAAAILTTDLTGEGQVKMHSLTISETYDQTRWVSPDGTSTSGTSANDPAKFNDTDFWDAVDSELEGGDTVRVVFKTDTDGEQLDYEINSGADSMILLGVGSLSSHLLIEGESPHGARIVITDNATDDIGALFAFKEYSANITLRNMVFQDLQTGNSPIGVGQEGEGDCGTGSYNYCVTNVIGISRSSNIRIENISMQDLPNSIAGGIRPQLNNVNLWIRDSDFIGIGFNELAHSLYPHWGSGLIISDNYSEDSTGAHFKFKGKITGSEVIDNEFVSKASGWYHTSLDEKHTNFVVLNAVRSTEQPGWFGSGYHFSGNTFDYRTTDDSSKRTAILISHSGKDNVACDPTDLSVDGDHVTLEVEELAIVDGPRNHLLTQTEAYMMHKAFGYDEDDQKYVLRNNFGLDFDDPASIYIGDNSRVGHHTSQHIEFKSAWEGTPSSSCTSGKVQVIDADLSGIDGD